MPKMPRLGVRAKQAAYKAKMEHARSFKGGVVQVEVVPEVPPNVEEVELVPDVVVPDVPVDPPVVPDEDDDEDELMRKQRSAYHMMDVWYRKRDRKLEISKRRGLQNLNKK